MQVLKLCQAGRTGQARACGAGRDEDQGQRFQAQGDELRADGEARRSWRRRSTPGWRRPKRRTPQRTSCTAATGPATRCRSGWPTRRPGGEDPRGQGGAGGGGEGGGRSRRKAEAAAEEKREAEPQEDGRPAARPADPSKAQSNFTDPESRIMKARTASCRATTPRPPSTPRRRSSWRRTDPERRRRGQLVPMADAIETNLGAKPAQLSADSGYCSEANLAALEDRASPASSRPAGPEHAKVAPASTADQDGEGRGRRPSARSRRCASSSRPAGMRAPIACASSRPSLCSARSSRPAASASSCCEASTSLRRMGIVCTAHNLLKLFQGRIASAAASESEKAGRAASRSAGTPSLHHVFSPIL